MLRAMSMNRAANATRPKSMGCSSRANSAKITKFDTMVDPVPKIDHRELLKILAFMFIGLLLAVIVSRPVAPEPDVREPPTPLYQGQGLAILGSSLDLLGKIPPALIVETVELKIGRQSSSSFRHPERLSEQNIRQCFSIMLERVSENRAGHTHFQCGERKQPQDGDPMNPESIHLLIDGRPDLGYGSNEPTGSRSGDQIGLSP
jgi:hypothetical protein